MTTLYNEDFSDISELKEEADGTPITIDTDLLCNALELWVQRNLTKGSRSVFYSNIKEEDLNSYETALGKAVTNEVIIEAVTVKAQEVIEEHEKKKEIPPEPVMPEIEDSGLK